MQIDTTCTKCGSTVTLDLGDLNRKEAERRCRELDVSMRECPGHHVELGGWWKLWNLKDALHRAFDLGEGKEPEPILSDEDFVQGLRAEGKVILDGGCNTVPQLRLRCIHDIADLKHIGFGNFKDDHHDYLRIQSPRGTRFYECKPI